MDRGFDTAIASLSAPQHGNVTRQQLLELGVGAKAIMYRLKVGRLHRVYPGVYAVGRPPQTALERAAAAVLACGAGAALSHHSALALWGFTKGWAARFDVTVAKDRRPKDIRVHLSMTLARRDVRKHHGIRVTSPARTLLDCAPCMTERALRRALNDALLSGHLRRAQLAEVIERNLGHPGHRRLIAFVPISDGPTRSQLEDAFLALCERFGLPRPQVNTRVAGYEVDAFFEAEKLIVELDGFKFHASRDAFERDRERDADTIAQGLATVRITWERMEREPRKEADRLLAILQARRV